MTNTTTDAAEARARLCETLSDADQIESMFCLVKSDDIRAILTTAEAASGAGEREASDLVARIQGAVTYQYMPMQVRTLLSEAAKALASLPPATDPAMGLRSALQQIVDNDDSEATVDDLMQHDRNAGYLTGVRDCADIARAALAAAPTIPATGEGVGKGERPYPELLSTAEHQALLTVAEEMWRALQTNNLGGYAGRNRPFYILHEFRRVIETFGRRDTGLRWSKDELDAHSKATIPATGHAATEEKG